MATATSIVMNSVDQASNKSTRSITHVNPSATQTELKNFVEGLNGLTTNTLADARRVDTTDIINDAKLSRNLTVTPATISYATIATSIDDSTDITISGAGLDFDNLQVSYKPDTGTYGALAFGWHGESDTAGIIFAIKEANTGIGTKATGVITLTFPANETYEEATATITVTE